MITVVSLLLLMEASEAIVPIDVTSGFSVVCSEDEDVPTSPGKLTVVTEALLMPEP
jgi:hypothetical protein